MYCQAIFCSDDLFCPAVTLAVTLPVGVKMKIANVVVYQPLIYFLLLLLQTSDFTGTAKPGEKGLENLGNTVSCT